MILLWQVLKNTAQIKTDILDMLFLGSYLNCLLDESVTATINFSRRSVWTAFHEVCIVFFKHNRLRFLKVHRRKY